MKLTLARADLARALAALHRVVERRNTIPILSNVLLQATGDTLALKATDLDLEMTAGIPATVAQPGGTTVPAHLLFDIVRKLPEGGDVNLQMEPGSGQMIVRAGRSRFTLQALDAADFPDLSAGGMPWDFELPPAELLRLLNAVVFAISTEETRYYLNGIYLHAHDGEDGPVLRAVATDGHRLGRFDMPLPEGAVGLAGIILPKKAVGEITKLAGEKGVGSIRVEISQTKARFTVTPAAAEAGREAAGVTLTTKLIDGTFPDYMRVIPTGNSRRLAIETEAFVAAIERVSTISSERGRAVKLALGEGTVRLTVNNPDSGSSVDEVDAEFEGEPLEIGFNGRYLADILGQLGGGRGELMLATPGEPTILRERPGSPALYVLMPMRV